jgi:tRNA threonylcarbamoyladenosine biosynthesis protein TsaB
MVLLGINLSVAHYGIGLTSPKGKLIIEFTNDFARTESLIDDITDLLAKHDLTLKDITKIGVVQGPGSYTGSRIACTLANTLNQVNQTPILGMSSLEVLAHQSITTKGIFILTFPRSKYDINAALFSSDGHTIHRMTADFTWPLDIMAKKCSQFKEPIAIIGQGYDSIKDDLLKNKALSCHPNTLTLTAVLTTLEKSTQLSHPPILPLYSEPQVS